MPPAGPVPPNVHIIIEGYGIGQHKIESIQKGDVFLTSAANRIMLVPVTIHIGQYLVSQIVLKPQEPLLKGQRYSLQISGINPKTTSIPSTPHEQGWYSTGTVDITSPQWKSPPAIIGRKSLSTGNNPSEWIRVFTPLTDEHRCYVLVTLKNNIEAEYERSFLLPIKNGSVYIGHGTCNGPFNINSGYRYTAQLIPCDVAGNINSFAMKELMFSHSECN